MKFFPIIASAQGARLFSKMGNAFGFAAILASLPMSPALADEWWVGAYGGYNTSFDSDVTVKRGGAAITYGDVSWDGASFEMPPYWGVRGGNDPQFLFQTSMDSMYIFHIGAMSNVDDNGCSVTAAYSTPGFPQFVSKG